MSSSWRFIAQRALTGEFLEMDLEDIDVEETSWVLSGAGALRGTVAPDLGNYRADDGSLLLEEWGTLLYAESYGQIRWGGILIRSGFTDGAWHIEAAEMNSYPNGLVYSGKFSSVHIDPLDAVREIWRHVQSYPDGGLGVVVDPTTSPVRLGTPKIPAYWEVSLDGGTTWVRESTVAPSLILPAASAALAAPITAAATTLTLASMSTYDQLTAPYDVKIGDETITVGARSALHLNSLTRGVGSSSPSGHSEGTLVKFAGTPRRKVDAVPAVPYVLAWYDNVDCGSEISNLASETPFDWAEQHSWNGAGGIDHRLRIGHPRLGRKRWDLSFEQGVNIVGDPVVVMRSGDGFANDALGLGAGEGPTTLRAHVPSPDGRLRRTVVFSDKSIRSRDRLTSLTRRELGAHRRLVEIQEVTVEDHVHARIGSWSLGDDVLIQASIPWLGDVAIWSRIVGWSRISDTRAKLNLARSDSFTYGRASQ